ncbi:MAG: hypothetical protein QXP02_06105 [Desulfurococcaceae archaeon]
MLDPDNDKISKMKKEIIEIIDESREIAYKVAFYSQPEVQTILNRLFDEWERNNRRGIPLDYAIDVEIRILHKIAKEISRKPPEDLWASLVRDYMRR